MLPGRRENQAWTLSRRTREEVFPDSDDHASVLALWVRIPEYLDEKMGFGTQRGFNTEEPGSLSLQDNASAYKRYSLSPKTRCRNQIQRQVDGLEVA